MSRLIGLIALALVLNPAAALELQGTPRQGAMVLGQVAPGTEVKLDGESVSVTPQGRFVIGFGRDAAPEAVLTADGPDGESRLQLEVQPRQYRIQRIEGIDRKIMQPSAEDLKRIRRDARQVRQARARHIERTDFAGEFQWPLVGPVTGVYGSQRVYNGEPGRPHYGVDVAAPKGTPVTTPAPGVVTLAHPDMFYSGGTLIIDHGYGVSSTFLHLSKLLVEEGDEVAPGDIVAEVGAGGRATGAHLDWRMNWRKARIDPQLLVEPMPEQASAADSVTENPND